MYRKDLKKGFTLIEVIVASAVFLVVMVIATGALLALVDANRKVQSQKLVINNLNFAIDDIIRNIRVGSTYHCGEGGLSVSAAQDCTSGSNYFAFEKTDGDPSDLTDQVVYRLNGSRIERSFNSGTDFEPITPSDVEIVRLNFVVSGSQGTDTLQPKVNVVVQGRAGLQTESETEFDLQTVISQRLPD